MTVDRPTTAFAENVAALVPHLRAFARALTRDPPTGDDLVQDTLVLALQAQGQFTPGTNLKAWLFTILRNRFRTLGVRRHRVAELRDDARMDGVSVPAFQEGLAELRHFKAAFSRLPPSQREVLVLSAVHGLPYEEIAEVAGCAIGTVKSRINRARTALKAMLLGEDAPEGDGRERPTRRPNGRVGRPEHRTAP